MSEQSTSLVDYWNALKRADWYYEYSDDHGVWTRGANEMGRLQRIAKESPGHQVLYDGWRAHMNSPPRADGSGRKVPPPDCP